MYVLYDRIPVCFVKCSLFSRGFIDDDGRIGSGDCQIITLVCVLRVNDHSVVLTTKMKVRFNCRIFLHCSLKLIAKKLSTICYIRIAMLLLILMLTSTNSNSYADDVGLKQAVEQQLDLILKMEDERKALRKQNRLLQQKLKDAGKLVAKYKIQTTTTETNTENSGNYLNVNINTATTKLQDPSTNMINNNRVVVTEHTGVQTQNQSIQSIMNNSTMNTSKLHEAQSILKVLKNHEAHNQIVKPQNNKRQIAQKDKPSQTKVKSSEPADQSKQITAEMINLTKQLNLLKKELKETDHKYKLRQKQIKQLKKCLETKNEALEKSKKQFNELSILLNTDKFKSVRALQSQIQSLKSKLTNQESNSQLKSLLTDLTEEYSEYRKQTEKKIDILVSELASKQKQIEKLSSQNRKSAKD